MGVGVVRGDSLCGGRRAISETVGTPVPRLVVIFQRHVATSTTHSRTLAAALRLTVILIVRGRMVVDGVPEKGKPDGDSHRRKESATSGGEFGQHGFHA